MGHDLEQTLLSDDNVVGSHLTETGGKGRSQKVLSFRRMEQLADYLFDRKDQARKAALILNAILEARTPRLTDMSHTMRGNRKRG